MPVRATPFERPTAMRVYPNAYSNIPPELSDRVLDFLHNDEETLKSCSLVCKSWLPASRYHLWYRVALRFASREEKDYARFLKSSPVITSCVVDLTVDFACPREGTRGEELDWMQNTLLPIFSTFRFLRQLMFANARFDDNFITHVPPNLSSLRVLQLSLCNFPKFSQFVELIWGCPYLETLRLDNVTFDEVDTFTPRPPTVARPQLKFLMVIFYSSHMPTVIDWLISEDFCSHLDFLVVFQLQVESPAVTRLLPVIGSHLRHLSVSYAFLPVESGSKNGKSILTFSTKRRQPGCSSVDSSNTDLFPTISHCTDLRTLNFLFAGSGSLAWIPIIISQINSPHVEEIDLGITDVFSSDDFERFDWASLWRSLTAKKFVRLKSVRFMVAAVSDVSFSDTKACIRRHLKGVDTKGLIQVESVSPDTDAFAT